MRLKTITLSILFLLSIGQINAQCEIGNGSFEEWVTADFILSDGMDSSATAEVLLPESTTSFLRLFFLSFSAAFDPSVALLLETEAQELIGISQSTDASDGEFSVKLQAGYDVDVADIYAVFGCSELPEQVSLDVKHVGNSNDSLTVAFIFDQGLGALPQTEEDLELLPAYAYVVMGFDSTTNYETITLPVIQNFEAPIDTFYYVIIARTSDTTYFLIDNVHYGDDTSGCQITAPTLTISNEASPTCICNNFDVTFPLVYSTDPQYEYNELIIDVDGMIVSIDQSESSNHDEFCYPTNDLTAMVIAYEVDITGLNEGSFISDLDGCFALSNEVALEITSIPAFEFNIFLDDDQQDDFISICLMDDIIEAFTFSADIGSDKIAILVLDDNEVVVMRIDDINEVTTLMGLDPGDYLIGAIRYDETFNIEIGQDAFDLTYDGCFSVSDEAYVLEVLGPDDNCTVSVDELYTGNITVRPNFSNGLFEIYNPNNESFQLTIRDLSGKTVQSGNNLKLNGVIDLGGVPNGLYIATFNIDGFNYQQKLIRI